MSPKDIAPAVTIKERLVLQQLGSSRPESYELWRLSVKAEVVGRGGGTDEVTAYVEAIESKEVTKEMIMLGVRGDPLLRALDTALYAGILSAITGLSEGDHPVQDERNRALWRRRMRAAPPGWRIPARHKRRTGRSHARLAHTDAGRAWGDVDGRVLCEVPHAAGAGR